MYGERTYRRWVKSDDLVLFEVREKETDLAISADKDFSSQARQAILNYRSEIEDYIKKHPAFRVSLKPVKAEKDATAIVAAMTEAAKKTGVGPMAAVAGAMAEFVGRDLLKISGQVIVENGGDIFMKTDKKRLVGVYAGAASPFSGKLAIEIVSPESGTGVCTSSGTVSHSLSLGKADAVLIISEDAALADASATAVGNAVMSKSDIEKGIALARSIEGVKGALILVGDRMGSWGEIRLA